jgi:4-hydroxy-tetrahydrodipicolinate synthase
MVGVAYQDAIVRICSLYWSGKIEAAFDLHDALLPLIRHEKQGPFGLAIRKEIMRRRGAMNTNFVRYPGSRLDARDLAELDVVIDRFEARLAELAIVLPALKAA